MQRNGKKLLSKFSVIARVLYGGTTNLAKLRFSPQYFASFLLNAT
jgi:hypothetical protein